MVSNFASTELIDMTKISLSELFVLEDEELDNSGKKIKRQISKPRTNLGSSGPPGRTD